MHAQELPPLPTSEEFEGSKQPHKLQFRLVSHTEDIDALVTLAEIAHSESRFRDISFSAEKVERIAADALARPERAGVFLAQKGSDPVGFAYASVGEYHIGADVLIATIHNINVVRGHRASLAGGRIALGLFKGVETWARARGAREVLFHVTSGVELARSHKLAKRMGYELIGGSYGKALD